MSQTVSVLIEGNYVDAYLYGGLLLVWDERGRLGIVSTDAIARVAAARASSSLASAQALFVDNKKLRDADARLQIQQTPLGKFRNGDGAIVHMTMDALAPQYFSVATDATVLDLMATYGRLYVSTDESLLEVPFNQTEIGDRKVLLGIECLATTPKWGAVNASCGSKGAWAMFNQIRGQDPPRAEQIDEVASIRHGWLGTTLVSFNEDNQLNLLRVVLREENYRRRKRRVAEGFVTVARAQDDDVEGDEDDDDDSIDNWFLGDAWPMLHEADFATVATGLLLSASAGKLNALHAQTYRGHVHPLGQPFRHDLLPGRVLSIADSEAGFVVETSTNLQYLDALGVSLVVERETISLRAYPRSRRHRRAVTATVDGGLLITALLGDHTHPQDERSFWPPPSWW